MTPGSVRPGAVDLLSSQLRSGALTPSSVVGAAVEAALRLSELNAFTLVDAAGAAEAADAIVPNGSASPLAAIPFAVKDLIDEAGRPNTLGTGAPPLEPEHDATVVARLRAAGAVSIGRTGLHELAYGFTSENHWFGPVRNPWDLDTSPGGSSGGSGAAVAARIVPFALGTDTGGSIRVPAALCGVWGLKPTHGRVSLHGVFPLAASLDTVGPLAFTVADLAAAYVAMAGDDPEDPWSAPQPVIVPGEAAALEDLVVGIPRPWVDGRLDAVQRDAFTMVVDALRELGADVVDLELDGLGPAPELGTSPAPEIASVHRQRWETMRETIGPETAERLGRAFTVDLETYVASLAWRSRIRNIAGRALRDVDVLMTPTVAGVIKRIGVEEMELDGTVVHHREALWRFTAPVNHTGLPALAVPVAVPGFTRPGSVQLIARAWHEHRLIEIGAAMEREELAASPVPPHAATEAPWVT